MTNYRLAIFKTGHNDGPAVCVIETPIFNHYFYKLMRAEMMEQTNIYECAMIGKLYVAGESCEIEFRTTYFSEDHIWFEIRRGYTELGVLVKSTKKCAVKPWGWNEGVL